MAARNRRRGRRRNRGRFSLLYKLFSTLLILAAILTGCIVFFRANEIVVSGESRYSAEEIIAATGVEKGQNLFQLDKNGIVRKVLTQLPYIDTISLSRKLPDTLLITVTESRPVAALEYNGSWWLMDARGKLLEQGDATLSQGRAWLLGLTPLSPSVGSTLAVEEEQETKLNSLKALMAAMAERDMTSHITEFIDLTSESDIRFGYDGTLTVEVPLYSSDFDLQARRLDGALKELQTRNGTVSGTLTLPTEGNRAWLTTERWMPETQLPEYVPNQSETGTDSAGETGTGEAAETQPTEPAAPSASMTPVEPTQSGE